MIAFIKGKVSSITPTDIVLDTASGLGYNISISIRNYESIKGKENVKLYTHLHIRDDAHVLYGFLTQDERLVFRKLITVSGVGPSTAMLVLSTLAVTELQTAISQGDSKTIQTVKGIGEKTAKRIVIDLKDKLNIETGDDQSLGLGTGSANKENAISALVALGYNKADAAKTVTRVCNAASSQLDVETIIKLALKST